MDMTTYQEKAKRTMNCPDIINASLGLCGESGEVADVVKKFAYQGHDLDRDHIIEELGDILWYVAQAAESICVDMSVIAENNIRKLLLRYPDGFSSDKSINRRDLHEATQDMD